jgi:hypothetical protein
MSEAWHLQIDFKGDSNVHVTALFVNRIVPIQTSGSYCDVFIDLVSSRVRIARAVMNRSAGFLNLVV